jgi:spore coat polysaccharide biosynthesis protein SpsF
MGGMDMKIGFLITARLKSSRLKFKIIKDLKGKTVTERLIDRAKEIANISSIVLCTSTNPQDKPLVDIAQKNGIYYFNGDPEDVLVRLRDAARFYGLDHAVCITADNPLFTIHYSDIITDEIIKHDYDYITLQGLPLGAATYSIKVKALETVCEVKNIVDTEIWGYLINRPEVFDLKTIEVEKDFQRPDYRLTLDYDDDYDFLNHIYNNIPFDNVLNLYDVIQYLDANPEIVAINKDCIQLDLDQETKDKINELYTNNLDKIKAIKDDIYSK